MAEKLADGLDLQTLVDLSIIYARTNATQMRAILAAGLESSPPEVESELLPALTSLLSASQGLYALRKTGYCIASFLHVCPRKTLRTFTHSKEFIVALAKAYDAGLSTLAHSYGGLSVSDSREPDEVRILLLVVFPKCIDFLTPLVGADLGRDQSIARRRISRHRSRPPRRYVFFKRRCFSCRS